jgi:hypothetical protein
MELCIIPASSAACEPQFRKAVRHLGHGRSRMAARMLRWVIICLQNMSITERVLGTDAQRLADFERHVLAHVGCPRQPVPDRHGPGYPSALPQQG